MGVGEVLAHMEGGEVKRNRKAKRRRNHLVFTRCGRKEPRPTLTKLMMTMKTDTDRLRSALRGSMHETADAILAEAAWKISGVDWGEA